MNSGDDWTTFALAATVLIEVKDGSEKRRQGTGFFVAPRVVATCAHVLAKADEPLPKSVFVTPKALPHRQLEIEVDEKRCFRETSGIDLAFLTIPPGVDINRTSCALVSDVMAVKDELWAYGFPQNGYGGGSSVSFIYQGPSQKDLLDETTIDRVYGAPVGGGYSGSLVVNQRTGAVCGMICTSDLKGSAHLLPVVEILARSNAAALAHATLTIHQEWLSSLTDAQILAGGWKYAGAMLREYLSAIKRAADLHPYSGVLPGIAPPPLSAVYVQQLSNALKGKARERRSKASEVLPAEVAFDGPKGAFLIGVAGAGKSSLFRAATLSMVERFESGIESAIPVCVLAADLVGGRSLPEAIAHSVNADLSRVGSRRTWPQEFFSVAPLAGSRWLVMVDGFDEIMNPDLRDSLINRLNGVRNDLDGEVYQFVIASRPDDKLYSQPPENFDRFELLPFSDDQLYRFSEAWLRYLQGRSGSESAELFLSQLGAKGLLELARTPLMATMLCQLFFLDPKKDVPVGRHRVFHVFIGLLAERQYANATNGIRQQIEANTFRYGLDAQAAGAKLLEAAGKLIGRLAWRRQEGFLVNAADEVTAWTTGIRPSQISEDAWRSLVCEMLRRSGLLVERQGDFVFLHRTIEEFLAAQFVASDDILSARQFKQVFGRRAKFGSGKWLTVRESYLRFLLATWQYRRDLPGRLALLVDRSGIDGARLVSSLIADGVTISEEVIVHALSVCLKVSKSWRDFHSELRPAIETSYQLDHLFALELLAELATDSRLDHGVRRWAIANFSERANSVPGAAAPSGSFVARYDKLVMRSLANLGQSVRDDVLVPLAADVRLDGVDRRWAAQALVDVGDGRGLQLLEQLVEDETVLEYDRLLAAEILEKAQSLNDAKTPTSTHSRTRRIRTSSLRYVRRGGRKTHLATPESEFIGRLVTLHRNAYPGADTRLLLRAFDFAQRVGTDYASDTGVGPIAPPLQMSRILAEIGMDTAAIAAGLLCHTGYTVDNIKDAFGAEIADIVAGVQRLNDIAATEHADARTIQEALVAFSRDPRVLILLLVDRLQDMRMNWAKPRVEQVAISESASSIFAPLAERLGMGMLRRELEDLAIVVKFPQRAEELERLAASYEAALAVSVSEIADELRVKLMSARINAEISGMPVTLNMIYEHVESAGMRLEGMRGEIGIRIQVGVVRDCYAALGVIHSNWAHVPGKFFDYIAMPQSNMYQSLHTTVTGLTGREVNIEICTHAMRRVADYGIAAHYKANAVGYNQGDYLPLRDTGGWRGLLPQEIMGPHDFLAAMRFDLSSRDVYVFTPKGKMFSLPAGSTPVDFAYAVHTEVGHKCVGARVNGKPAALASTLASGDAVEILVSNAPDAGPSEGWAGFVRSGKAGAKIRQYFRRERARSRIETGKDALVKAMRVHGMPLIRMLTAEALSAVARDLRLANVSALYAAVGESEVPAELVVEKLLAHYSQADGPVLDGRFDAPVAARPPRSQTRVVPDAGVSVVGFSDVWITLGRCCTPMPPDAVFGFIKRSGSISVHRDDCINAVDLKVQAERIVETSWKKDYVSTCFVVVQVEALDRHRLLADMAQVLSAQKVNIFSLRHTTATDRVAVSRFGLEIRDSEYLSILLQSIREIGGVFDVYRVTSGL
ncbi:HD domain-containing protein [Micromonospora sp. NPDC005197]|uniref:HD domain-containing protein n=1 Tax=Micromonospora sp. NPDC005197 TaxID=3157020 RepID=UPI00339DE276